MTFIPPHFLEPLVRSVRPVSDLIARTDYDLNLELDESVSEAFAKMRDYSAIICPNHPDPQDPIALVLATKELTERVFFMTAREVFMRHPSLRSLWLQSLGCYSVERGMPDVRSIRQTLRLLSEGNNKVVIFPEGEISHQSAHLMDLEPGVAQLAMDVSGVLLLPMGVIYRYHTNNVDELVELLKGMEATLNVVPAASETPFVRLCNCYAAFLADEEELHNLKSAKDAPLHERVRLLLQHWLKEVELEMLGKERAGKPLERLHYLKSRLVRERFDRHRTVSEQNTQWYRTIRKATRLIGLHAHSFEVPLSQEQFAELLTVLGWQLYNRDVMPRFPRTAFVRAGNPIDISMFDDLDWANRKKGAMQITNLLRGRITAQVDRLMREHQSLACFE